MTARTTLVQRLRNTTFLQVSHPHFAPIAEAAHEAADELDRLNAQALALCAEISRLRRDAERYRWLRQDAYPQHVAAMRFGDELDAAIDAAMQEGER